MLKLFDYTVVFFLTDMNASVEKLISLPMLKLFYYTVIFFLTDMNASIEYCGSSSMLKLFDYTVVFFHTDVNASVEKLISLPMLKLFYYTVIFFLTDMNASLEWFDQSIVPKNRQKERYTVASPSFSGFPYVTHDPLTRFGHNQSNLIDKAKVILLYCGLLSHRYRHLDRTHMYERYIAYPPPYIALTYDPLPRLKLFYYTVINFLTEYGHLDSTSVFACKISSNTFFLCQG